MPDPITVIESVGAHIPGDNIDTDQIIPSREIKTAGRDGLSDGLFANQRYINPDARIPKPEFPLNVAPFNAATILISGANFGCGSSREHAVWALHEFGIRAVCALSFGGIFYGNCLNNGIAPIVLSRNHMSDLLAALERTPELIFRIDLKDSSISSNRDDSLAIRLSLNPADRKRLLLGLDLVELTLQNAREIDAFIKQDKTQRPWAYLG